MLTCESIPCSWCRDALTFCITGSDGSTMSDSLWKRGQGGLSRSSQPLSTLKSYVVDRSPLFCQS